TKKFETIYRGDIDEIISQLNGDKNNLKGEFVVIINKAKHRLSQNKI
ncbi:rRNA (cytidine-2'-O-)-methyltransferase, partial [Candidatus Wolfebacteria bacterium]|nr:rRNA (cytidine-2'-O-)-methyltransferase [Candidatus Wolfebacteria bacterium]